jgi:hypothetical protein
MRINTVDLEEAIEKSSTDLIYNGPALERQVLYGV